jgi:cytoskeletal protein RodZ
VSLLWFLLGILVGALLTWLFVALPLQRKLRAPEKAQLDKKAQVDKVEPTAAAPEPVVSTEPASANGSAPKADTNGSAAKAASNSSAPKTTSSTAKPRTSKKAPASKNGAAPKAAPKKEAAPQKAETPAEAEPAATAVATIEPGPYPRSARSTADGSAPSPEYTIKGNAGSKLYHTPSSPYYGRTKAEAWFATPEDAEAAGFTAWRRK